VISIVQDEFRHRPNAETEARLRATQTAVRAVFARMNIAFQHRGTMEFGNDREFMIRRYLACFDAIFTLNQDMLLELYYPRNDPGIWMGTKWNTYTIPGMSEVPQTGHYPYDVLKSKWHPSGDFRLRGNEQPLIKLHGSSNWESQTAEPMLVIGKAKLARIKENSVLKSYFDFFTHCLSQPDTRLTVIGYGFADDHINEALLD